MKTLRMFNGEKGKAESFNLLDDLLSQQLFRLSFWKVAAKEINYRRFFCMNGLISLKVVEEHVLNHTHGLIFDLIERRIVTGLRIDHVDGLYDPMSYLQKVRGRAPTTYIVVEKILNLNEDLPPFWPVQGTTGYDFANYVNELFCQKENERAFSRIYSNVTGLKNSYEDVVRDNKKLMIQDLLTTREDGRIKLFLIYRALKAGKTNREIFREGAYLPLVSTGRFRSHVVAFARRHERQWALVIAPRFPSHLVQEGDFPLGREVWQNTEVILPVGSPAEWRNVITSEALSAAMHCLSGTHCSVSRWPCSWVKEMRSMFKPHKWFRSNSVPGRGGYLPSLVGRQFPHRCAIRTGS